MSRNEKDFGRNKLISRKKEAAMKKGHYWRLLLSVGLVLSIQFGILSFASAAVNWRMPVLWAKGSYYYEINGPEFANLVKKMSNGEMNITPFGPGEIVKALDQGDALSRGTFEIMFWHDGYWTGRDTALGYFGYMPFANMNYDDFDYWFWQEGGVELVREYYRKANIHYIGNIGYSDLEPLFSKKPVTKMEDFKGLKMRSSGIALSFFKHMGASVVALGGDETYEALSRGVIDAVEHTPASMMLDMGIQEVTKYAIEPLAHQPYTNVAYYAYAPAWDKLPAHLKEIIFVATRQIYTRLRNESRKRETEAKKFLQGKGMQFIMLSQKEQEKMRNLAQDLWKQHAKETPFAHATIKSLTDFLKKEGRLQKDWKLD